METMTPIEELLLQHEGFRPTCYRDSTGHLTIGIGCNLDASGALVDCLSCGLDYQALRDGEAITMTQATALLQIGVRRAEDVARILVPNFPKLPENAQLVLIDLAFNLGSRLGKFADTLRAFAAQDWPGAIAGLKDSIWYHQVGFRARNDIALLTKLAG